MTTVDGKGHLAGSLHYDPSAYWCPHCWAFTKDCRHLVPALTTRLVVVDEWLIRASRYDRSRAILEVQLHAGGTYQHYHVPLDLALKLARSEQPGSVYHQAIKGKFRFERVRS